MSIAERLNHATFIDTLLNRRSRRFGLGMKMPAGPLAYTSQQAPRPLDEDEEAALAFAASGITGPALADLCYASGGGGNIMNGFVGRTIASGDGIQSVALFVINDQGAWLVKRPREFEAAELKELMQLGREKKFAEVYRRSRVQVQNTRVAPPLDPLFNINCNRWSLYAPGTTYFLPVNDLTFLYINGLLEIFNETTGAFVLDERAGFRPAGLEKFARSQGGHLDDDFRNGRVATIGLVERLVTEFVTVEQGMMLQNMALMAQALGLGSFPNFANHEFGWCHTLGFRMGTAAVAPGVNVPVALGLERDGKILLQAHSPPYFESMAAAVKAVVDAKTAALNVANAWKDASNVGSGIPPVSEAAVAATTAYCEYVWKEFGRFPAYMSPFRTVVGCQACHLDTEFYEKFYRPEALAGIR